MNKNEVLHNFKKHLKYLKDNSKEIEFEKIYFIKKELSIKELKKLKNKKRAYLKPLLKKDSKNF